MQQCETPGLRETLTPSYTWVQCRVVYGVRLFHPCLFPTENIYSNLKDLGVLRGAFHAQLGRGAQDLQIGIIALGAYVCTVGNL